MTYPLAIYDDTVEFVVNEGGCLINDTAKRETHFLNLTAYYVLASCDGATDAQAIAERMLQALDLPELPLKQVEACLEDLTASGLIRAALN